MYRSSVISWLTVNRRRLVLGSGSALTLALIGAALYSVSCGFKGCPSIKEIRAFGTSRGNMVALERIPENVRNAFIAVEDRRFTEHGGVDWRAFGRAFLRNAAAFEVREGASTLTMQVARNAFIEGECNDRTFGRKLIELRLAPRIERALSKDEVLGLYLNLIYLGDGIYGVEAASRHYFGKGVARLSLSEAAMLAALPRAPSVYHPKEHPDRAMDRRNLVLRLMAQEGYITLAQADAAAEQRLAGAAPRQRQSTGSSPAVTQVGRTEQGGTTQRCLAS